MVSDQEIAHGVENLLRHSDPNTFTSLNGVVQHLEAKLGLDLSHKAGFIRDQIELLLRPPPPQPPHPQPPHPQPQPPSQKDHFALQHHPQFQNNHHAQISHHFAIQQQQQQHHHHQQQQQQQHHHHHQQQQQQRHHEELNFQLPHHPQHPNLHPHQHLNHLPAQVQQQSRSHPQAQKNAAPDTPKESAPAKRKGGAGGLNKVCGVSPELQAIVGEPKMPRTEIVKQLWAYIRKNNLQDPSNKRKIICNDELRLVFETDCTDMFKMNKLLSKHITRLEPPNESASNKKRAKVEEEAVKVEEEAVKVEEEAVKVEEEASESTEAGSSLVIISDPLAKFFGSGGREMVYSEALKRVSEYIEVNQLKDPMNPMVILCDEKLQELFGCESISALGVAEMVGNHLFKQS